MTSGPIRTTVVVCNPQGLHMRPADLLVRTANQYQARVSLSKDDQWADCKSILSLLTLGAEHGSSLVLAAEGDDAEAAIRAIGELFAKGFFEMESTDPSPR
jgi:phosphocarrier protein HPr